jgi:hypothetical protein
MIIYLIQLQFCWRRAKIDIFTRETGAGRPTVVSAVIDRRYKPS